MKHKKLRVSAILLALCFLLAACGGGGTDTATEAEESPAAEETVEATEEAPESPEETPEAEEAAAGGLIPGTYEIQETGMKPMIVSVTLSDSAITDVTVSEHRETDGIGDVALEETPKKIVELQSVSVDTIAGATITSGAIIRAAGKAITEAGGDVADFSVPENATYSTAFHLTSEAVPSSWDESYEVVVVGSGFAGLAAAHTSATAGANTVIFEKMAMIGGNSKTNGGQFAAYTSERAAEIHEKQGTTPDTPEKHFEDTLVGGDNEAQPELIWNLVYGAPVYLDLMLDNGMQITDKIIMPGGHYGYRTYVTENQIGYDMVKIQKKLVEETGVTVECNAMVTQIYREDGGKVVGVRVETADGAKNVEATGGVVLAAGGFGNNIEMREANNTQWPTLDSSVPTTNHPGATGDGIVMGEAIGAQVIQMDFIQLYPFADPNTGRLDSQAVIPFSMPSYGGIYVDINGERYVNEGERRDVCAAAAQNSAGFPTFAIFDSTICEKLVLPAILEGGLEDNRIIVADTLEELAEKLNAMSFRGETPTIDPAALTASVEGFNNAIASGTDEQFGRPITETMLPSENAPFYAVPAWPSVHHTMGGVKINANTEVLDAQDAVIPGLFAAGEVTGGVHGTNRLGGNAGPDAVAHGVIAGQMAATGQPPEFSALAAEANAAN